MLQVHKVQTVFSSNPVAKLATAVLPVHEVMLVQPVPWDDKADKVQTAHQVSQARTVPQVPQALEVDQVTTVDQVSKAELAHQVQPVPQAMPVQLAQKAATTECTDPFTLDIAKRGTFHLALMATHNSGPVTLFSTPLETADQSHKILVLLVLACEALPLCHSCTVTSTNNVMLPPETTSLTGCLLPSQ